jgi:ACS family glucarate transporter-like MFS transporter/ACS family D-galactonate transporter-like MFS transporter
LFTLTWSLAMLATGLAPAFWMMVVAQLVMGVAQAGLIPATCNSVGRWMPLAQRSLASGILTAGMQIGAIAAAGLTGVLLEPWGWRVVFVAFALPGILWTYGFFVQFRDDPAEVLPPDSSELALIRSNRSVEGPDSLNTDSEPLELLAIAISSNMWWLCGQQVCRSAGYMFFASWFPTFLQVTRGVSVEASGYLQGIVLGGALMGCILGGLLTDWVWRRTGSLRASRSGVGAASLGTCALIILGAWCVQSTEGACRHDRH